MQNSDLFRLDGHTLRVFASICETGSVTRTAEAFEVNQSTISHTLDKMRSAVGDPLFVKSGRGITPSDKALSILPRVLKILADIEGLVTPESYEPSLDKKSFVLAISTPGLLNDMKALHANILAVAPGIQFELRRLAPREHVTQMLQHDEADLAITVAGFRYPALLNHCHYGTDTFAVFYDPKCRPPVRTVEDFAEARHGVINYGGQTKGVAERALGELGLKRKVTLVAPTASMLGDLIRGTDIIATMPTRLASTYHGLKYVSPPFVLPSIEYQLVWHRRNEHSGRNMWLREMALNSRQAITTAEAP